MSSETKSARILARTFFNQLQASGYTPRQVVGVATELLDLVAARLREDRPSAEELKGGEPIEHTKGHATESRALVGDEKAQDTGRPNGHANGRANGHAKGRSSRRAPVRHANGVSAD